MRMTLSRQNLSKALALLNKAVAKRPFLESFKWVKLKADEKHLMLQGTDGDVYLTLITAGEVEVKEEGEACVEAKALLEAVKSRKDKFIELYTEEDKLVISGGGITQKLALKPAEEFPLFPEPHFTASLPASVLAYGIEKVGFAVAKEEERGSLAHLFIDGRGDHVRFVGSDNHRLAVLKLGGYDFDLKVKLYFKSLRLLHELLKGAGQQVHIGFESSKKFVYLTNGFSWTIAIQDFSEARYPDYEAVVPPADTYETIVKVSRGDLANALENFKRFDKIIIEFTDSQGFTIKAQDTEVFVKADVRGNIGFSLGFTLKRLKEFTDVVGAYTYIEAMFKNDDNVPAMFKVNDNYFYLVMPLIRKR